MFLLTCTFIEVDYHGSIFRLFVANININISNLLVKRHVPLLSTSSDCYWTQNFQRDLQMVDLENKNWKRFESFWMRSTIWITFNHLNKSKKIYRQKSVNYLSDILRARRVILEKKITNTPLSFEMHKTYCLSETLCLCIVQFVLIAILRDY